MLYIHQLKDLTPKSADIEVVPVIREIKTRTPFPLREANIREYFELFFVSESERRAMSLALEQLPSTINDIQALLATRDKDYETVNLQRAVTMLKEIPVFLLNNFNYAKDIAEWQEGFVTRFGPMFNSIPGLRNKSQQDKIDLNTRLNSIFEKLLRNTEFCFNYRDLVSEGQVARATDLNESMEKGFFFHVLLEEEIKKKGFDAIRNRISGDKLRKTELIKIKIDDIKKGVVAAYDLNMRMIQWALVVYGYIKWLNTM